MQAEPVLLKRQDVTPVETAPAAQPGTAPGLDSTQHVRLSNTTNSAVAQAAAASPARLRIERRFRGRSQLFWPPDPDLAME